MAQHTKDTARVAAGLKAAIHNPNVSKEAKEHATARLKEMGQDAEHEHEPQEQTEVPQESTHVLAGYKATISNPHTSEEAKRHAQEVLEAAGIYGRHDDHTDEEHETRVLAGYKAALHNPRVSDAAKQHALQYLEEHGVNLED
ncbi:hypothetical protein SCLCIDRAFT_811187 [Scleroderma citrinum Foug A]|uniref:Conidiation protein 6 n=1 Tax=Scleroderma citrinum Foug A TaxID=1036808 RepID=A0A0C3A5Q1_9AGAM|nr:hypothetical protein SCLCIDRAFT_811187 [Scleroderma citrinum Foug A]